MSPESVQRRRFGARSRSGKKWEYVKLSYPEYLKRLPKWQVEILDILPVEDTKLKKAVLGGELAVPCTCNPL